MSSTLTAASKRASKQYGGEINDALDSVGPDTCCWLVGDSAPRGNAVSSGTNVNWETAVEWHGNKHWSRDSNIVLTYYVCLLRNDKEQKLQIATNIRVELIMSSRALCAAAVWASVIFRGTGLHKLERMI
jgi:hypothetical protein